MVEVLGPETLTIGICYQQPPVVVLRVGSREVQLTPATARCVGRMLLEAADMADPPGFKTQLDLEGDE
jgi:hypothetical protein